MSSLYHKFINANYLKLKYSLNVFVETGCCDGGSTIFAADTDKEGQFALHFPLIYACDIRKQGCDATQQAIPRANIYNTDSITFLRNTIPLINGKRTMFWLDAHLAEEMGNITEDEIRLSSGDQVFPIKAELDLLTEKIGIENDVIMCDDYFGMQWRGGPDMMPLVDIFNLTHNIEVLTEDTGVLLLTPKC